MLFLIIEGTLLGLILVRLWSDPSIGFLEFSGSTSFVPSIAQPPVSPDRSALVGRIRDQLLAEGVDLSGPCGAFAITKRVAWELRTEGFGLIEKGGNNCDGYSTDAIFDPSRNVIDLLVDSGGENGPTWDNKGPNPDRTWGAPFDPGGP